MQIIRCHRYAETLLVIVLGALLYAGAQTASVTNPEDKNVILQVVARPSNGTSGEPAMIDLTVTNGTKQMVEIPMDTMSTPFKIIVHDRVGKVPRETVIGCKLHNSDACGEAGRPSGIGNGSPLFIAAGGEFKVPINVGRQYLLETGVDYTISIELDSGILINAPPSASLGDIIGASKSKLGTLRSNEIVVKLVP